VPDDAEIVRVVTSSWRWLVTTRIGPEGWRRTTKNSGTAAVDEMLSLATGADCAIQNHRFKAAKRFDALPAQNACWQYYWCCYYHLQTLRSGRIAEGRPGARLLRAKGDA